jgi:hypothetical protein
MDAKTHWENVYMPNEPEAVSWDRPHLETIPCASRAGGTFTLGLHR